MISLSLSTLESNDSAALVFTDNTGTGTGGWGDGSNINVTDIDGITHTLTLKITRKTLDKTVIFDDINLYTDADFGGPWSTVNDLVFTITPLKLLISGVVETGITADSLITDGIYDIIYVVDENLAGEAIYSVTILAYNQIKVKVYDKLRSCNDIYNAYDSRSKEVSDILLQHTLLKSIEAMAYVALEDEILNALDTIEKINVNGSNYTWQ